MLDPENCKDFLCLELVDDEGEGSVGRGFSSSLSKSLKRRAKPGCICLAIMGKLLRRSLKDLISFFRGSAADELSVSGEALTGVAFVTVELPGIVATTVLIVSNEPTSGLEM